MDSIIEDIGSSKELYEAKSKSFLRKIQFKTIQENMNER